MYTHRTASANSVYDLEIAFTINGLLAKKNRTHSQYRLSFDLVSQWNLTSYIRLANRRNRRPRLIRRNVCCSRVSTTRVGHFQAREVRASHPPSRSFGVAGSEAATRATGEERASGEPAALASGEFPMVLLSQLPWRWLSQLR